VPFVSEYKRIIVSIDGIISIILIFLLVYIKILNKYSKDLTKVQHCYRDYHTHFNKRKLLTEAIL